MRRFAYLVSGLVLFLALLPVGITLGAGFLAGSLGCALDEGSVHPCLLFGTDIGGALYTAGMMFWLGFLTLPLAALATLAFVLLCLIDLVRALRR